MSQQDTLNGVPFSLEMIIKGMPEHAYIFSKEGKLLTWNKNIEILLEYSAKELKNKFVTELICKDDKDRVANKFIELIVDGDDKERIIEYCIETKHGRIIPCLAMRSVVIVDGIEYMAGILINLTKIHNDKKELKGRITKMNLLKSQLQDYYNKIDQLNQVKIELQENHFINSKEFNNILINNLPGIFYLCEKVDDKFYIKRWNDNFETKLGYSKNELLNMQPYQTFTNQKEYAKVEKAIQQIFTTGSAQVTAIFNTKDGRPIPYLFDGYLLEDNGKTYFMGIGMNLSYQILLEKKQKLQEQEKLKSTELLESNKRELITTALERSKTSKIIDDTLKNIDKLLVKHIGTDLYNDLTSIQNKLKTQSTEQDNWEIFRLRFTKVHKNFFINLKETHPTLSKSELKFCAYLRIHLSSHQISSVLNITNEGIKKSRYRIRKKMELESIDSLEDYIAQF